MSAVSAPSTSPDTPRGDVDPDAPEPESRKLRRLAVETAGYLGVETPGVIPTKELRAQAEANGYSPGEIDEMLSGDVGPDVDRVRVPERGDLLGSLWRRQSAENGGLGSDGGYPLGADVDRLSAEQSAEKDAPLGAENPDRDPLETFRAWLQSKLDIRAEQADARDGTSDPYPVDHAFSRRAANERFAKIKDVGRFAVKNWDWFTTVHIVRSLPRESGESVAEHAKRYAGGDFSDALRTSLKSLGVYDEYAGVALLAPHEPDAQISRVGYSGAVSTHQHLGLWLPGIAFETDFSRLQATSGDVHISVQSHRARDVETPESVKERGSGLDTERGDTTALAQELGSNLPLLRTELDARGLREPLEYWAACMRLSTAGDVDSRGIKTFRPLRNGYDRRFNEYAESVRSERIDGTERAIQRAVRTAQTLGDALKRYHLRGHERPIDLQGGVLKRPRESAVSPSFSRPTGGVDVPETPFAGIPPPQSVGSYVAE